MGREERLAVALRERGKESIRYKVIGRRVEVERKNENRLTFEHKNNKEINCKKPRTKKKSNYYRETESFEVSDESLHRAAERNASSQTNQDSLVFSPLLLSKQMCRMDISRSGTDPAFCNTKRRCGSRRSTD